MPQPMKMHDKKPSVEVVRAPRKRSLSDIRPSKLRKAHDSLLGKHADKIKELRDSGIGRVLVIISCGPSANDVDVAAVANHPKVDLMCVNKPDDRVWPTQYWIFCDQSQYIRNQDYWETYGGIIINAASVRARHNNQILLRTLAGKGFSRDVLKGIHIGRSTTYTSMQVALFMNYHNIFILGCDMSKPAEGQPLHRYGVNPDVAESNRVERFAKEADNFWHGANILKEYERDRFIFCSEHNKWPFVDKFNRISQFGAEKEILKVADELMTAKEYEQYNVG
jgi:hypothetical protein